MLIFITGFMGVGKTTIGRQLALNLNIPFIDLDEHIEAQTDSSIVDLFSSHGEDHFREVERKALLDIIKKTKKNCIIALGGGTMCHLNNHIDILRHGVCLYLKKTWSMIEKDLKNDQNRPIVLELSNEELYRLFKQREPIYALSQVQTVANTVFDLKNLENRLKLLTNR